MPIARGSSSHPAGVIVTSASLLGARQLMADLSIDQSLEIRTAISASELAGQINRKKPAAVLLDTKLVGDRTPALANALAHQQQIAVVLYAAANERPGLILDAMENGAIAVVTKPVSVTQTAEVTAALIRVLTAAAAASIPNLTAETQFAKVSGQSSLSIFALGAGMGGLPALTGVLAQLPGNSPAAIVITGLNGSLTAEWVNCMASCCEMRLKLATDGDAIQPGQVLVAPGDSHLIVRRSSGGLTVGINPGPAVHHQIPSLDLLFNSLTDTAAQSTIAAVFSGSGIDGVAGLLNLRKAGGRTIAQQPQSCPCDELPSRALATGGAQIALPANQFAQKLMDFAKSIQLAHAA